MEKCPLTDFGKLNVFVCWKECILCSAFCDDGIDVERPLKIRVMIVHRKWKNRVVTEEESDRMVGPGGAGYPQAPSFPVIMVQMTQILTEFPEWQLSLVQD